MFRRFLAVVFFIEVGLLLIVLPWSSFWDRNYFVEWSVGFTPLLTSDYTRTNTQIIIAAGSTTGTITVTAVQDLIKELDESVFVEITTVINGTENGVQSATTTIIDDDV